MSKRTRLFCLILLFAAACRPAPPNLPTLTRPAAPSPAPSPTNITRSTPTFAASTATPTSIPTEVMQVCSPIQGAALEQLSGMISNPFHPPAPGSDDPHQGVDLADRLPNSQVAVSGRPVQAALTGKVAGVVRERFPYGNAVLIETPLESIPPTWQGLAHIPTGAPTLAPVSALTCPPVVEGPIPDTSLRSIYTLYAHMQSPPSLATGQPITCGEVIGSIGESGNALHPHLHFEARAAPAGMSIVSMAHYDASASAEEMSLYCLWRVSGLFQLVDPMKLLGQ